MTRLSHAAHTKTPSPPGEAPASISGTLAASIQSGHDGPDGVAGPTTLASSKNGPYARFLELGGTHAAHNKTGYMHWLEDGTWRKARAIKKTERPYMKPAVDDAITSGAILRIYYDHWLTAQQSVT